MPSEKKEKRYFTHCDCEECNKMADLLERLLPVLQEAHKESRGSQETPLGFVLECIIGILENMFIGRVKGVRIAGAHAASLAEFIQQDGLVAQLRGDLVDMVGDALSSMFASSLGVPQLVKIPLDEAPEELRSMIESAVLGRMKNGGGNQNFH